MGPYVYEEENPFTLKTTGVAPGGGHGSIFVDKNNNVWGAAMMPFAQSGGRGDTLISLYPAGVDEDGVMHGKTEFGDYPQYLPGVVENPIEDGFTGWVLLSLDKKIEASSTLENCWTAHAVDENTKSFWSAETGDPGEYITVDLGPIRLKYLTTTRTGPWLLTRAITFRICEAITQNFRLLYTHAM